MMTFEDRSNFNFQAVAVAVGVLLFGIKITAWYLTDSVAILTDALESIVNILAGSFTLYSLYLSALPQDKNHPYGHGKIEFVSAGIEGTLIVVAGCFILYEAFKRLFFQDANIDQLLGQMNAGLVLVGITGVINYLVGFIAVQKGRHSNSLALVAGGKHLQSDAYSTAGLMIGLLLILITKVAWLDAAIALIFGSIIIYTGVKIIRSSIAGIMDEADEDLIERFVDEVNRHRKSSWVDLHKVRFIKYGNHMHLDCHLTLPWYLTLRDAHKELDAFEKILFSKFGNNFEMFVHTDDCLPESCEICPLKACVHRERRFVDRVEWTKDIIILDKKHSIEDIKNPVPYNESENPAITQLTTDLKEHGALESEKLDSIK